MAQEDVYGPRTGRTVGPHNGTQVIYAFKGVANNADALALGQAALTSLAAGQAAVFGARQPKPERWARSLANGRTNSGFADWRSINSLEAANDWNRTRYAKAVPSGVGVGRNSVLVVVDVAPNLSLCWYMKREQYNRIQADLNGLGVEVLTNTNNNNAAVGVNSVIGISLFEATRDTGEDTYSVKYISPTSVDNMPAGWVASSSNDAFDARIAPDN